MLAGEPEWMISRSVAQIATASIRTRTSARAGTGTGLSRRKSRSGSPRTQAFIWPGTTRPGEVLTPDGRYIGEILLGQKFYRKRRIVASHGDAFHAGCKLCCTAIRFVAKPSYAAYTWSPVGAEVLFTASPNRSDFHEDRPSCPCLAGVFADRALAIR